MFCRTINIGFQENSRMLVDAIHSISSLSYKTFTRKLKLINCFGFSNEESLQMFIRSPTLLRTSEKELMEGMEFFLHTFMLPKYFCVLLLEVFTFGICLLRPRSLEMILYSNLAEEL
ncbi:hypothetical protein AAZX31_12G059100 [Glycine max]